jgi:hypothetical protein
VTREGVVYLMAQLHSPGTVVSVDLSYAGGWPDTVPAPAVVRHAAAATGVPVVKMLAGAVGTRVEMAGNASTPQLRATFPGLGSQALFSYSF